MRHRASYFDDYWDDLGEAEVWIEADDLGDPYAAHDVLRSLLREEFSEASPAAMNAALGEVLSSMSAGESFNFAKALQQIGGTASQVLTDPTVNSALRTALPLAGGAVGTLIGPLGTVVGSGLGNAVAGALPPVPGRPAPPAAGPAPAAPGPASAVAAGSEPAKRALALANSSLLHSALAQVAIGQNSRGTAGGVNVPAILGLFNQLIGAATAHADELAYTGAYPSDAIGSPDDLYEAIMDADTKTLADLLDEDLM